MAFLSRALHKVDLAEPLSSSTVPRAQRPDATFNKAIIRITLKLSVTSGRCARGTILLRRRLPPT